MWTLVYSRWACGKEGHCNPPEAPIPRRYLAGRNRPLRLLTSGPQDMADAELRQRKPQAAEQSPEESPAKARTAADDDDAYSPWVDILRVISFLLVASWVLSYLFTGGESGFWGMKHKPKIMQVDWWKAQLNGPVYLTPEELAAYDGSDETKPVYLALNGTIYDVSNGRHIYGPGGSYSYFSGCDAARAFVTGCFAEDRTPDMRGVEDMYLPIEDADAVAQWNPEKLAIKRARELEKAKKRAHDALQHWVDFFGNSKKYTKVGYVKRDKNWLDKEPKRALCAAAQQGRPKRQPPRD
ncbi:heme/steroid binding domain-containing protein [Paramyrothecium foliicola]|nr:heme/steroid binding domain-containing protein [Paramyrothecium foliicola]